MTVAAAPRPWPAPATGSAVAWHFARALEGGAVGLQWVLRRHCRLTPAQLFAAYFVLCAISLAIALGSTWQGAPQLLAFATVELLLVAAALLLYARHATDQERITLADGLLRVEHRCGQQTECTQFRAAWVRVEPRHGEGSLVELSGDGRRSLVGRYLRAEMRTPLAHELRSALRAASGSAPTAVPNTPLFNRDLK